MRQRASGPRWSSARRRSGSLASFLRHQLAEQRRRLLVHDGRGRRSALAASAGAAAERDVERRAALLVATIELGALAGHVLDDRVLPALRGVVKNRLAVGVERV